MASEPPEFAPVTLEGKWVRLEPLAESHVPGLALVAGDPAIFRWYPVDFSGAAGMRAFCDDAFRMRDAGTGLTFAIVSPADGTVIGSSRFGNIERKHRRAEIGWTWLAPAWQRTPVNTEMKYLMLRHAFETLRLIRVEFKTDSLNEPSRRALTRIGAREEGTFRNHMVTQSGRVRHSVYFSIIDSEWTEVKRRLEHKLAQPFARSAAA